MGSLFPHLLELLEEASRELPGVSPRRMFGCDALFAYGNIYALVWKDGRIGLKLPEPSLYEELMAMPGAARWEVGPSQAMSTWVLVPEDFHDDSEQLQVWVRRAHELASKRPPKALKLMSRPKAAKAAPKASKAAKAAHKARKAAPRRAKATPKR